MRVPARLRITVDEVTFEHGDVMARHRLCRERAQVDADLRAVTKARRRAGSSAAATDALIERYVIALDRLGKRLGEHFLVGEAGAALAAALRAGEGLRLAVEVVDPALTDLPWEMTVLPGQSEPFALDRRLQVFRTVPDRPQMAAPPTAGPLRILAVVASPEHGDAERLDYEAEVDRILSATDPAVHGGQGAQFEKLEWGSLAAVEAKLHTGQFHVLHVTAHAAPGVLMLEDDEGYPDHVSTSRFAAALVSSGHVPPLVVLSACSTGSGMQPGFEDAEEFTGMARGLLQHGVPAVLAMTAAVSDLYATELAGMFYQLLAANAGLDPLTALTQARQDLEKARKQADRTAHGRAQVEWWVPTLYTRVDPGPLYTPAQRPVPQRAARSPFIGRRAELRTLGRHLKSPEPHIALHGLGGSGVSSLANALAERLPGAPQIVRIGCDQGVGGVLDSIADALNLTPWQGVGPWARYLNMNWPAMLQCGPLLLLAEVSDATLLPPGEPDGANCLLADQQLAWFFTAWTQFTPTMPLVLTAHRRFDLPGNPRVHQHQVGPLHPVEARLLARRLPALDADAQDQVLQAVGGHPGIFQGIAARTGQGLPPGSGVVDRLIESCIDDAADSVRLAPPLVDADWRLLLDVAVFKVPVGADAFGTPGHGALDSALDRLCAAGLVVQGGDRYLVDRWVARVLLRGRPADAADAHRRAAAYWRRDGQPANPAVSLLQARDHLKAAGELADALLVNDQACRVLADLGQWSQAQRHYKTAQVWVDPASADAARIARGIGDLWVLAGDDTRAQRYFDRALVTFRRVGDEAEIVETLRRLGVLAIRNDEKSEGQGMLVQVRERAEALGATLGIADTYRYLGLADLKQNHYTEAETHLRRALARYEAEQDHRSVCLVHIDIGDLYRSRKMYCEALTAYRNARMITKSHPSVAAVALSLICLRLGSLSADMGLINEAEELYNEALELQKTAIDLPGQARTYRMMAALHRDERHNFESAVEALVEALDLAEDVDDDQTRIEGLAELADLYKWQGKHHVAMVTAAQAFQIARGSAAPFAIEKPLDVLNHVRENIGVAKFNEGLRTATDSVTLKHLRRWLRRHRRMYAPSRVMIGRKLLAFAAMQERTKPRRLHDNTRRYITGYLAELTWPIFALAVVTAVGVLVTGSLLCHTGQLEALKATLFMVLAGVEVAAAAHIATALRGPRQAPNWFIATVGQPVAPLAGLMSWLAGLGSLPAGLAAIPSVLKPLFYPRWQLQRPYGQDWLYWPQVQLGFHGFVRLCGYALLMLLAFIMYAAVTVWLRTGQPLAWPEQLRPTGLRRAFRSVHIQVVLRTVADGRRRQHTREDLLKWRRELLQSAVKAQRFGATSRVVDALIVAYDLDMNAGEWSTTREAAHELATRMRESTEEVMGAAPPTAVLNLLGQATEREPVRARAALAAYCTGSILSGLARRDADRHHLLEAAVRAVTLYTELVPTDTRRFQPFSSIASADAAKVFHAVGLADIAIDYLRSAISAFREHPWGVGWWPTDLVRLHVELAQSFVALHRTNAGTSVVHEMLADINQYFAGPDQLPADLGTAVNELRDWADRVDSANRQAGRGPR
ncbi:CHAT domain-containing protein [Streptomyces sp. NPDC096311]|uniref:CHAT domain-containing protein n=1 Tax=Streptomyces sp. NPDC096311 TaxID=3366083 RepID=UPI003826738B